MTRKIIDEIFSEDVDMELMEKLTERRIKIEATNKDSTPCERNLQNSKDNQTLGENNKKNYENKHSFKNHEEYKMILKEIVFNRTRI